MTGDLRALANVVQRAGGVRLSDGQLPALRAALARVDPRMTPSDLVRRPDLARIERLVDQVATKETFFLRHLAEIAGIDWRGKAARAAAAGRPLRIWSAGCSSGEEAYTLAILAAEALGTDRPAIDVLGSDLSARTLARAVAGTYGIRSMGLLTRERREQWFVADGDRLRVGASLRRLVRFQRHNLVRDAFPPLGETPFDLIVCRNVLLYFDGPTVLQVSAGLRRALAPDGRLLLGTIDGLSAPAPVFSPLGAVACRLPGLPPSEGRPVAAGALTPPAGAAEAAVHVLRRALYLDPERAVLALRLARALEALGHPQAAAHAYRRALRLVAESPGPGDALDDREAVEVAASCHARLALLGGLTEA